MISLIRSLDVSSLSKCKLSCQSGGGLRLGQNRNGIPFHVVSSATAEIRLRSGSNDVRAVQCSAYVKNKIVSNEQASLASDKLERETSKGHRGYTPYMYMGCPPACRVLRPLLQLRVDEA